MHYHNIRLPLDPAELIDSLDISVFSLMENGENSYLLGYCNKVENIFSITEIEDYDQLTQNNQYLFGYIPYDQKNHFLPQSDSKNEPFHNCSGANFFKASGVFIYKNETALFFGSEQEFRRVSLRIQANRYNKPTYHAATPIKLIHKTTKEQYIKSVNNIKEHIQNGDIYEMNYCITLQAKHVEVGPKSTYENLRKRTKAPFSGFLQINEMIALSASPERFVNKSGDKLISQPIKGTIRRGLNRSEDKKLISILQSDLKEIAENIMIVDLVRNDLSKIAKPTSVEVKELCSVYSFKTVHQLISTIKASIKDNISLFSILKALFPMGSMTGAPKLRASELIDKYENFKREMYSGALGFISPNHSFDFSVIIRSIIYNTEQKTLSISAGSAITIKSNPLNEYEECILKLQAIQSSLSF